MYKRYIDNTIDNRVDFVFRYYDISIFRILTMLAVIPLTMFILYLCNITNSYITIAVNCVIIALIGVFITIKLKYYLKVIAAIEYQNMIFANALNHNTEFCLIIDQHGKILYSDTRFRKRFHNNLHDSDVFNVLKSANITDTDIQNLKVSLKNKDNIQIYFSIRNKQKNKLSNFSLILDSIPNNPEIEINADQFFSLSLFPLARPKDYFVLKAVKISREQVYEKLIDKHCTASYLLDNQGIILSANKSFLKLFELERLKKDTLFSSLLANPYNKNFKDNEIMLSTFNGINFYAHITEVCFYDKYNNCYTYGLLTPISSTIDYHNHPCFKESSIAIAQCNSSGIILKKNKALTQIIGEDKSTIFSIISAIDHKKIKKYFNSNTINNMSLELQLYNNSYVKIHFNKFIHDNNIFVICYFIDSADRKKLESQLEHSQKMQSIGQLAGGIAHDFNNILTAIMGFCDLLLIRHNSTHPSFADIMQIKQLSNRASDLIKHLLAFSRRQTLQPKILDPNNVIGDLLPMIKRLINESIELEVYYEPNIGLVKVDICQLEQVIINLVVNARSAMEMGGNLTIKTYNIKIDSLNQILTDMFSPDEEQIECGEYVAIEVTDTGCGIEKEIMMKIFEPFFSTKEASSGGGLGLSTVYGIIKQTGGYIHVSSKVNFGTKFIILLPRVYILEKELQVEYKRINEEINVSTITEFEAHKTTILLIEDEAPVRILTSKALISKGYNVIDIDCANKALDIVKNNYINLIISDVVMPGMSGPEIVEQIIKLDPNIRVIFISGYAEEVFNKHNSIVDVQKTVFLPKPFTLKQLVNSVETLLKKTIKN